MGAGAGWEGEDWGAGEGWVGAGWAAGGCGQWQDTALGVVRPWTWGCMEWRRCPMKHHATD